MRPEDGPLLEELLTHITPLDALLPWRECLSQIGRHLAGASREARDAN